MSAELMWIRSHVERCLQQVFATADLRTDDDDDFPFRWGSAMCWVAINRQPAYLVRISGHAAYGVRRSAKLLHELNDISARADSAHLLLDGDAVVVQQTLHPAGVTAATLDQACTEVAQIASHVGPLLVAVHGGATPCPAEAAEVTEGRAAE